MAHAQRATFVLSILSLAPSLSPPRDAPQVDCTRPQTFHAKHVATTSNHTLAIIINWVQRMGQMLRHYEKVLQIVW